MAISTLDAFVPALEDLITPLYTSLPFQKGRPAAHSRYPTRYLLLHELDDYEDEVENIRALALVREMPARCKSLIDADGGHTKY
jgi:hypothetical protein